MAKKKRRGGRRKGARLSQTKAARAARARRRAEKGGRVRKAAKAYGRRNPGTRVSRRARSGSLRGIRWAVKCGKRVVSKHRKKSAAKRATRSGCRVLKVP